MTYITTTPAAPSLAATPAAKTTTHGSGRRGTMDEAFELAEQASYIEGWKAGKKAAERYQRVGDLTDVCAFSALAFAAGLAIGLYIMAPAF